jgi:hypothetical protein
MSGSRYKDWRAFAEERLDKVSEWANEEQTKLGAIVPFFQMLGYDAANQRTFRAEAAAGIAQVSGGRADFAIFEDDGPIIAVECKARDVRLERHAPQLFNYMRSEQLLPAPIGVLTNGVEYHFFDRLDETGEVYSEPFLVIELGRLKSDDLDPDVLAFLDVLGPGADVDEIRDAAKRLRVARGLDSWWRQQLKDPTEAFVRMVLQMQDFNRVTSKTIQTYKDLVATKFVKSLAREVAEVLPSVRTDRGGAARLTASRKSAGAITTQREYEVFQRCLIEIAQRCETTVERQYLTLLGHKDYAEHFKIFVEKTNVGRILDFQEMSGDGGELFQFADGETVTSLDEVAEPLMRNYRAALRRLTDRRTTG